MMYQVTQNVCKPSKGGWGLRVERVPGTVRYRPHGSQRSMKSNHGAMRGKHCQCLVDVEGEKTQLHLLTVAESSWLSGFPQMC